ncbi:MAG: hypothetical protein IKX88_00030 [Thermoguttaceae bacterium]|nr:hypothetical protein [Thermoguttaceae bacterium]MBR5756969.1 hypothetical protein [Thermoguttaceae bacterium]
MKMTLQSDQRVVFALVFTVVCVLATSGCERSDTDVPKVDSISTEPVESAASPEQSDSSDDKSRQNSAEEVGRGVDAARVLSEATSNFSKVFSDGDEEDGEEKTDSIDVSLVDEETRRKYTEDRTLITPTLDSREDRADVEKYRLEYRFEPNTNLSWTVVHTVNKRISYGGKESLIKTSSTTYRRWEILNESGEGKVSARHWIDRMILEQREDEKDPITYDSERDVVVPKEISAFGTEKAVGVALETFDVNAIGVMSDKTKLVAEYQGREGDSNVVVPFPAEEVGVGDVWTIPYALHIKGADKVTRPYQVVERFRLEDINEQYATISFKTTLVSIVDDPVVEGELAERLFTGRALFDRKLGLTTHTEMTFDKKVTGAFGFSSFLDYNCRVVEKLNRDSLAQPSAQQEE